MYKSTVDTSNRILKPQERPSVSIALTQKLIECTCASSWPMGFCVCQHPDLRVQKAQKLQVAFSNLSLGSVHHAFNLIEVIRPYKGYL